MDTNKIYYEIMTAFNSYEYYKSQWGGDYGYYNQNMAKRASSIQEKIQDIIGFNGQTKNELATYISQVKLNDQQKKQLFEIRKTPTYKKIFGEQALKQKETLETLLGVQINNEGQQFMGENGIIIAGKDEDTLFSELEMNADKLDALLKQGKITSSQYSNLDVALNSIYTLYISQSKGEQIPFRKISDSEYQKIEEQAYIDGISPSEKMNEINQDMLYQFQEVQELALASKQNGRSM